ncbi:MAG TPA: VCBS repeat-containing protein [Vicinamibacteria bacterium]|nr:VCBS repeat-containing protein [Vicinamibacteria bacterium]
MARVTDIQPGDLDGDGDLAVAQFGYDDGEIRWMENLGEWRFSSHQLLNLPGTIHVPVADMDGDGDLDIAAVVSQTWEQIYVFENDGSGTFTAHIVYGATNEDFGSSGISLADLDQDGDQDVLYTNGDAFDYTPSLPRPWHGVQWLENQGGSRSSTTRSVCFPVPSPPEPSTWITISISTSSR